LADMSLLRARVSFCTSMPPFVHAKDDEAASFYRHFDFEPSPFDPCKLMLLMKDLERLVE